MLIVSIFFVACDQTPENVDEPDDINEPNDDTTDDPSDTGQPNTDPQEAAEYVLTGTWDEQGSVTLTTGALHDNDVHLDSDGTWASEDGAGPQGDLMVHQTYEGRWGTIARIEPVNGTTLCQYSGNATRMSDITGSRCGLARFECDPVDAIYLDHIFYADHPDQAFVDGMLRDIEFNAYRVTDENGYAFEMIVHDRGFTNATDPWTPGEVTVDVEVLGLGVL